MIRKNYTEMLGNKFKWIYLQSKDNIFNPKTLKIKGFNGIIYKSFVRLRFLYKLNKRNYINLNKLLKKDGVVIWKFI